MRTFEFWNIPDGIVRMLVKENGHCIGYIEDAAEDLSEGIIPSILQDIEIDPAAFDDDLTDATDTDGGKLFAWCDESGKLNIDPAAIENASISRLLGF